MHKNILSSQINAYRFEWTEHTLLNGAVAREFMMLLSGAKNDLHCPACSKQTNEKLTIALFVRISAVFEIALRVKSVDYEPNVGWVAVTQGEVHRRCRGLRDTFLWQLEYAHI
jgi:hypothetical protein